MFLSGLSGWRSFFPRFLVSLFFVGLVYWVADYWTIGIWNSRESLVVRVLEAGPEAPREKVPDGRSADGNGDGDETFPALERPLEVLVLTGDQKGRTFVVVVAFSMCSSKGAVRIVVKVSKAFPEANTVISVGVSSISPMA